MGLREKIILGAIGLLIVIIPSTAFVISFRFRAQTQAEAQKNRQIAKFSPQPLPKEFTQTSALQELKSNLQATSSPTPKSSPTVFFGPTLSFKISIEARPSDKQAAKIFVGIASGAVKDKPDYLLSFNVDVPDNGSFEGLSLAGLTQGDSYSAYLKGPAQIATASAFTLKPTVTDLGLLNLITGDLNEDNVINSADYSIAKLVFGATPTSSNWNSNIDFNLDLVINNFDLGIISKHLGTTGKSGPYVSTPATKSGSLQEGLYHGNPIVIPADKGHWLWVPQF